MLIISMLSNKAIAREGNKREASLNLIKYCFLSVLFLDQCRTSEIPEVNEIRVKSIIYK